MKITVLILGGILSLYACNGKSEEIVNNAEIDIANVEQRVRSYITNNETQCVTLYRCRGDDSEYLSVRIRNDAIEVQTSKVGNAGDVKYYRFLHAKSIEDNILTHLKEGLKEGYDLKNEDLFYTFDIEYYDKKPSQDLTRIKLSLKMMDRYLIFYGLGRCSLIDGETTKLRCKVVDYDLAKELIERRYKEFRRLKYIKIHPAQSRSK
ncbi:hypothetical protein HW115_19360 [Verrucomicrobiaceae bacterium N1E253]|uniref:Lipoprotein n=1 Tax=Oceaniferula marina TaxID=2748318 RepID=A0A851GKB9_9BACT|nr:hypothetical protein [Oceaniferula marina]NWK57786.1 hypothetical protein [Oceaniferula marina]